MSAIDPDFDFSSIPPKGSVPVYVVSWTHKDWNIEDDNAAAGYSLHWNADDIHSFVRKFRLNEFELGVAKNKRRAEDPGFALYLETMQEEEIKSRKLLETIGRTDEHDYDVPQYAYSGTIYVMENSPLALQIQANYDSGLPGLRIHSLKGLDTGTNNSVRNNPMHTGTAQPMPSGVGA